MAFIGGVNGGGYSSNIYGNKNILSGLASGMDTESMIENAVSGHKMKMDSLRQQKTLTEWKQNAYRDIINKTSVFSEKYMSYNSSSNLMSPSFFKNAISMTPQGKYADMVSASGRPTSDIQIMGVTQLATKASYRHSVNAQEISAQGINLNAKIQTSAVSGSLTLQTGGESVTLNFGANEIYNNAQDFVDAINKKLEETKVTIGGQERTANEILSATKDTYGNITFSGEQGYAAKITGASGELVTTLNVQTGENSNPIDTSNISFTKESSKAAMLAGKSLSVTLDGVKKTIQMPGENEDFATSINSQLNRAFGDGKVAFTNENGKVSFTAQEGSTLRLDGDALEPLGLKEHNTNYVDVHKTLGQIWGDDKVVGEQPLTINGVEIGKFGKDTELTTLLNAINNNEQAGVTVSYSQLTNEFSFTAKNSGSAGKVEMGNDLAKRLFGNSSAVAGQDAQFTVKVNGTEKMLTRSDNNFQLDGMDIALKGTFSAKPGEEVRFETNPDSDKVVKAVRDFVKDFNEMSEMVKKSYSTLPAQRSNGKPYLPLTEKEREGMSESAIKDYEEKGKQGLLFGDREIVGLYEQLRNSVSLGGKLGAEMRSIGIDVEYRNGNTTLKLDEDKLRGALSRDPDRVERVFTQSKKNGAEQDGIMVGINKAFNHYTKVTGDKGTLVKIAGSPLAPTSIYSNELNTKINKYDAQIEMMEKKMNAQIDRYTKQFSQLEQLIAQMNSQSGALQGFMGGF